METEQGKVGLPCRPEEQRAANSGPFGGPAATSPSRGLGRGAGELHQGGWGWLLSEMAGPRPQVQSIFNSRKQRRNEMHARIYG